MTNAVAAALNHDPSIPSALATAVPSTIPSTAARSDDTDASDPFDPNGRA